MKRRRRKPAPPLRLTNETIDRYFAEAAATVKEVEESLRPCFNIPPSLHGMKIR